MQENNSIENRTDDGPRDSGPARHRAGRRFIGRRPYAVGALAAAALLGLGVAGVSVATSGHGGGDRPAPTSVADEVQARAEATQPADRSARQPVQTPSASPTARPSTTKAPVRKAESKPKPKPKPKPAWVNPMPGAETTSCFGMRGGVMHAGIDLAQPADTPIRAAAAGTVVNAGWAFTGYGISVVIDHGNGFLTHYAHQNRTVVKVGQKVKAGQLIGYEGATGDATGPHLHFEVHQGTLWNQVDPAPFMRQHGVDLGC